MVRQAHHDILFCVHYRSEVIANQVVKLASQRVWLPSPLARNEFGVWLDIHGFPDLALPILADAATSYPRELDRDRREAAIVRNNLLVATRKVNQTALKLYRQGRTKEAIALFESVSN